MGNNIDRELNYLNSIHQELDEFLTQSPEGKSIIILDAVYRRKLEVQEEIRYILEGEKIH